MFDPPFKSSKDEKDCVEAIAMATASGDMVKTGKVKFDPDEARRAKKLMQDDLSFLAEDHYDVSTYVK